MRIVLYAEGSLDTNIVPTRHPAPGAVLADESLGAAHVLVRRCLREIGGGGQDVTFESPLRVRARVPVGSDLLHRTSLRRLLTWPARALAPDLVVVLVDGDGHSDRQAMLEAHIAGLSSDCVVGVCVHEIESWLSADISAVSTVVRREFAELGEPHNLQPGAAKARLTAVIGGSSAAALRREVAERCDLARVQRHRSFELFSKALGRRVR